METAAACEIARLPEDLLSTAISCTTPRDACRAAAVSPAFRTAADSDAVWSTFLPCDLLPLADGEISPAPPSKKGLFLRLSDRPLLLTDRLMEASVSVGGSKSTRQVCHQGYDNEDEDGTSEVPENFWPMRSLLRRRARRRNRRAVPPGENVPLPQKRADGWLELEMGEFCSEEGEDGEVCISLMETKGGNWKKGLIVQGIEIRPKKSG